MKKLQFTYDGSFEGLLCCIFAAYEQKCEPTAINLPGSGQEALFGASEEIITETPKATRVMKALKQKGSRDAASQIYRAFLSEIPGIELEIFHLARYIFSGGSDKDFSNKHALKIAKTAKMVGREKHRMEAFIRFELTADEFYFAVIEPDFNVLPLIARHFKERYADQHWLIYDLKRKIGLRYDLKSLEYIQLELDEKFLKSDKKAEFLASEEQNFQKLWKNYFESTNIKSRANQKLHLQHVPKRYWKYLSEKNPLIN